MRKYISLFIIAVFILLSSLSSIQAQTTNVDTVFDSLFPSGSKAYSRLMTDNVKAWYARWYVIENAKSSIDMTYYIVEPDIFGMSLLGLLKKKAADGVKIRLMMDARGTKDLTKTFMGQDYLQELLEDPNIEIRVFNPISTRLLQVFKNLRYVISSNHDKIIVVDGAWVVTGGRNIAHHYFADPKDDPTVYRDTDVLLKGETIAGQIKTAFEEEFYRLKNFKIKKELFGNWTDRSPELELSRRAMQRFMQGRGLYKKTIPKLNGILEKVNEQLSHLTQMQDYLNFRPFQGQRAFPAGILDKHSFAGERNDITDNICKMIDACKKEVIIQNPYVVITEKARAALLRADKRGVKIIMHTNSPVSTDSVLTQAFFIKDWKETMASMPNLSVFAFKGKRKLHAKVFVFDSRISVIGTYNMDYMSEQINSEVVAAVKSPTFGRRLRGRIMKDIEVSAEYKVEVQRDGKIKVIYGPKLHSPSKTMRLLNLLGKFGLIKVLI